ncbi:equilibrative nucleoside transporter 4 isoform X2 [Oryctolagus cuniculus]|uniref:equilibrative nucleoside transporter 4 isoform X2 n=1 Tax=Oryctolagus cuniculus TaxID=9986 RepID=UPI003878F6CC
MGSLRSQRLQEPGVPGTWEQSLGAGYGFDSFPLEAAVPEAAQGQGVRARAVPTFTDSAVEEPVPDDRYHAIYFAMLLAGVGFLLPYNSFITDVDYLHHKYPGTSIVFDMSLTYILVALVAVLLNNVLVERLTTHTRIAAGHHPASRPCSSSASSRQPSRVPPPTSKARPHTQATSWPWAPCSSSASATCGCSSSLTARPTPSTWPPWARWPSAAQCSNPASTGTRGCCPRGTAGVMISLSRILTKLLLPDERASTLIFFLVSVGLELLCFLLHLVVRRSRFVRYYTARPRDSRRAGLGYRVHHDVAAEDVHFEHPAPALASGGSPKDSPAHEVTAGGGGGAYVRFDVPRPRAQRSWPTLRALLLHRYVVARVIWADMLSIAVTYLITLCLFPGLESEIRHCVLGEWLPILLMAIFNLSDFVGKVLAALPVDWRGTHLLACSCLRVVFIPLFVLCVYPSGAPALRHPAWPCVFSLLMGVSNGYFGSAPMILAAGRVSPRQRELAGNTMTVSYMSGLTLGSAVAYCTYSLTRDAPSSCVHTATNGSGPPGL